MMGIMVVNELIKEQKEFNANLGTVLGLIANNALERKSCYDGYEEVYRENIYMHNSISDFLFHLNICEVMGWWSTHLGIWMVTQVAFCWNILLQVIFCAWQDQWRRAVGL
jgi:hypothetical protein